MTKYTLYIGLNDKDTKKQEIPTNGALVLLAQYLKDATVQECTGFYTHENGEFIIEKSLRVEKLDFSDTFDVFAAIRDLKIIFNQESIAVESVECNSELV
jgi:hypothetical protein